MREHTVQCLGPHGLHRMAYTEWGDAKNPRVLLCVHEPPQPDPGSATRQILTTRGSVIFEARTNQLFVTDVPSKLEQIQSLIANNQTEEGRRDNRRVEFHIVEGPGGER